MAVGSDNVPDSKAGLHELVIDVLGDRFSITADKDSEYLNEVLEQYRLMITSTQGISGLKNPLRVAILTGFILCDEISKLKLQKDDEISKLKLQVEKEQEEAAKALKRTQNLIMHLDTVIERSIPAKASE